MTEGRRKHPVEEEGGDRVEGVVSCNVAMDRTAVGGPAADEADLD